MTPYELAKLVHVELSPIAPKLSASINRALVDIGEGSVLVGLGPGTQASDDLSFQASETIIGSAGQAEGVLAKIQEVMGLVEAHSSWKVIIDKRPGGRDQPLELLYTLVRTKNSL